MSNKDISCSPLIDVIHFRQYTPITWRIFLTEKDFWFRIKFEKISRNMAFYVLKSGGMTYLDKIWIFSGMNWGGNVIFRFFCVNYFHLIFVVFFSFTPFTPRFFLICLTLCINHAWWFLIWDRPKNVSSFIAILSLILGTSDSNSRLIRKMGLLIKKCVLSLDPLPKKWITLTV